MEFVHNPKLHIDCLVITYEVPGKPTGDIYTALIQAELEGQRTDKHRQWRIDRR